MIGSDAERTAQLVVEFTVADLGRVLDFYISLGFILERRDHAFAALSWEGDRLLFIDEETGLEPMRKMYANVRIVVPDVDAVWRKALALGADVFRPIADRPYGLRDFILRDPAGFGLRFAKPIRIR